MTPTEALSEHLSRRPVSPGAVGAQHPAYISYHQALSQWVERKVDLQAEADTHGISSEPPAPNSAEKAPKPAWTPGREYMARKQRESRERNRKPLLCIDCGGVRYPKRKRCYGCQEEADRASATNKNIAKAVRAQIIRRSYLSGECLRPERSGHS